MRLFEVVGENVMIHYDIDTTENAYCNLEGDVESLIELKKILFKKDMILMMLKL